MRAVSALIAFFFFWVGVSLSNSQTAPNDTDAFLEVMFSYARDHDVGTLEKLRPEIKLKKDPGLATAYSLALYIAAPSKYRQQYVDNFPIDVEGIHYLYERIELRGLTPTFLHSIDLIGSIAETGNAKAIEKVVIGIGHSDGGITELFCDTLTRLLDKQLKKTLTVLSRMDEGVRKNAYTCFGLIESQKFSSMIMELRKMKGKVSKPENIVIQEIEKYQ
jgi:hypothetical protein